MVISDRPLLRDGELKEDRELLSLERNELLDDRTDMRSAWDELPEDRKELLLDRDGLLNDRDEPLSERDELNDRDELLECDGLLNDRDEPPPEYDEPLIERDEPPPECDELLIPDRPELPPPLKPPRLPPPEFEPPRPKTKVGEQKIAITPEIRTTNINFLYFFCNIAHLLGPVGHARIIEL